MLKYPMFVSPTITLLIKEFLPSFSQHLFKIRLNFLPPATELLFHLHPNSYQLEFISVFNSILPFDMSDYSQQK